MIEPVTILPITVYCEECADVALALNFVILLIFVRMVYDARCLYKKIKFIMSKKENRRKSERQNN